MPEETKVEATNTQSQASGQTGDTNVASQATTAAEASASTETKQTLESVVQDVFKQSQSSSEGGEGKSAVLKSNSTEEKGKEAGAKVEDQTQQDKGEKGEGKQTTEKTETQSKDPVPYDRFEEVNKAKGEFESQLEAQKPLVEAHQSVIDHCKNNNISPDQFKFWMNVAAFASTDPVKALETLRPVLNELEGLTGDKLPQDLQTMVDNNEIPLALAKRLAIAENKSKFTQQRSQLTEQQLMQQRQQGYMQELHNAVNSWITNKKATDPDFVPKTKQEDPDGMFELVLNKLVLEAKGAKSAADLVAAAERSYAAIKSSIGRMMPKPNGTKVLASTRSTTTARVEPKTLEEVISARAKTHGIDFTPTSRK